MSEQLKKMQQKQKKKKRIIKNLMCILLSLLIGFVATYSLFYFSVDCYKYSSDKSSKSFSDLGFANLDSSTKVTLYNYGRSYSYTEEEKEQLLDCFKNSEYTELPLYKAFPLLWIAMKPRYYICEIRRDSAEYYYMGTVYVFNKSLYLLNYSDYDYDTGTLMITLYKSSGDEVQKIKNIKKEPTKSDYQDIGTQYQYLYNDCASNEWCFHFTAIFLAMSLGVYIVIGIVNTVKKHSKG